MLPTITPQRDPKLSAMAIAYANAELVGDSVGPILESETKGIEFTKLDKLNMFQDVDHNLARGGEANDVGFGAETDTVKMRNFGMKFIVLNEDIEDNEDKYTDLVNDGMDVMSATLALQREKLQASLIFSALDGASRSTDPGNWADFTGTAPDIYGQVKDQMEASVYGYDSAIIPEQVLFKMQRSPSLLSQFYSGNTGMKTVSIDNMKEMFGLREIIVPKARIASVRRPAKVTDISALSRVWGSHMILFKKASVQPNRITPGLYYQWRRRWVKGAVGQNMQVRSWALPNRGIGGAFVTQQEYQAHHHIFPEAGFVFKNVLA